VALVQFGGDREGASGCHRIVTLDRQWDSLEEIRSLTRISRDVGQSADQLGKERDAGCVDGTEGLQAYYYYSHVNNDTMWDNFTVHAF